MLIKLFEGCEQRWALWWIQNEVNGTPIWRTQLVAYMHAGNIIDVWYQGNNCLNNENFTIDCEKIVHEITYISSKYKIDVIKILWQVNHTKEMGE